MISNDNTHIQRIITKRRKNVILKEKENTNSHCCCSVWGNEAQQRIAQPTYWVFPQTCTISLPTMAGTAAHTTDLSDLASQQRAKCYFCICCLSCFKGHQKEDEKLMVLKVTAPKEERALESTRLPWPGREGQRREKPRKEKELAPGEGTQHPAPSCPTSACQNKYCILMFLHHPHRTNSFF